MEILRDHAVSIFKAGVIGVDIQELIHKKIKLNDNNLIIDKINYDLRQFEKIVIIGGGKASSTMAASIEQILSEKINKGIVITSYGSVLHNRKVIIKEAAHPIPDENGIKWTNELLAIVNECDEKTLVICLISGGASSLLCSPVSGVSLNDIQKLNKDLIDCGATIAEINTIRKHLSKIKGGQLVKAAIPATLVSLILSDVVGDSLDVIASGSTAPDPTSYEDAIKILKDFSLIDKVPSPILKHLRNGAKGDISDTPKPGDLIFTHVQNVLIGTNIDAMISAEIEAKKLGYNTLILSPMIVGETRTVAKVHTAIAKSIQKYSLPISKPACFLSGGETTVKVKGEGKGGRNQEFVLTAAIELENEKKIIVLSAGTDGIDGPTDAAGAICDGETVFRGEDKGMKSNDYLINNNSYEFFNKLDDLIMTGPTNTNVMDLRVILVN